MTSANRPPPRSYAHVPRSILWLVPGGEVRIDGRTETVEPFYLGKWPVTNEQFEAFDPDRRRPSLSSRDRDLAVGVNWIQADAYCRWYADVSRKPMRLPTRAEWLYACRGVSTARENPSFALAAETIDRRCWHAGNSDGRVRPPEQKEANDFGLHGMLGSVWEWVAAGPGAPDRRTLCGGSFRLPRRELRPDLVRTEAADLAANDIGFRIARSFHIGG